MRGAVVALLSALAAASSAAQSTSPNAPSFEVASVKPDPDARMFRISFEPGGRLIVGGVPLSTLIQQAYGLQTFELVQVPQWTRAEKFAITAKAPEGTSAGTAQTLAMLRTLLADRFGLRVHEETREGPIYELVVDRADRKLGPRLLPPTEDCTDVILGTSGTAAPKCSAIVFSRELVATMRGRSMRLLATDLQRFVGRPVVDKTGISDLFDIELQFALEQARDLPGVNADVPTIFTAVREQLGLRLESARGPVRTVVIDKVERPTPD
jgi:bla regulator protein BlaR1